MAIQLPKLKLDCHNCSNSEKRERGCTQDSIIPETWELDDWKFSRCPLKIVTKQSYEYIQAYNFYKGRGGYPNPGTWQQQPLKLLKVFSFIEMILEEEEEKK